MEIGKFGVESTWNHRKDYVRFLHVSFGSAKELEAQLRIAFKLGFISNDEEKAFSERVNSISRMIKGLIRHNISKLSNNH